jgi:hypothetical protein
MQKAKNKVSPTNLNLGAKAVIGSHQLLQVFESIMAAAGEDLKSVYAGCIEVGKLRHVVFRFFKNYME